MSRAFTLFNKKTGVILECAVPADKVNFERNRFSRRNIEVGIVRHAPGHVKSANINETAAAGSTGAGAIASRTDGGTSQKAQRTKLLQFLTNFQGNIKNKFKYTPVTPFAVKINEAFDINDVISRLSSSETDGKMDKRTTVTFGVEDDKGNLMRVTVRADKAADFERELSQYLSQVKQDRLDIGQNPQMRFSDEEGGGKPYDQTTEISMAEILYNMKDKFEIIDVDFPKIPKDVIYNVGDATYSTEAGMQDDQIPTDVDADIDMDVDMDIDGDMPMDADGTEMPADGLGGEDELSMDDEAVADFEEPTGDGDSGSILSQVMDMLKAQANAETARANAAAEQAKAEQARYTAQAASATLAKEEEMAKMELDLEEKKNREKEAKKLADLARYKVQSVSSVVREADEFETVQSLRRQRAMINAKYAADPADDNETRTYKARQRQQATIEIDAKIRQARNRERYLQDRQAGQQRQQPNQQQQNQSRNPNQQQNAQQQTNQQQNGNQI